MNSQIGREGITADWESMARNGIGGAMHLYLDLGEVKEVAHVRLNGKSLAITWKKPYRVEITGIAQEGSNRLEIEVTNLWINRMIGDERQFPDDVERRSIA